MDESKRADLVEQSSAFALLLSQVKQYKVVGWFCPLAAWFCRTGAGVQQGTLPRLFGVLGMGPRLDVGRKIMLFLASVQQCLYMVYEMQCFESRKGVYVSLTPSHGQKVKRSLQAMTSKLSLSFRLCSTGSRAEQEPACYTEVYEHVAVTVTE